MTKTKIDGKNGTMTLQFGEEEMPFYFANIKKQPYEKKIELKEEKTIADLAADESESQHIYLMVFALVILGIFYFTMLARTFL
jgi:hypothetical protein